MVLRTLAMSLCMGIGFGLGLLGIHGVTDIVLSVVLSLLIAVAYWRREVKR